MLPPSRLNKSGKVRSVIVKFIRCNDRRKIYINEKLLKGTKVSITESLTAQRVAKLKEANGKFDFKNVWSNDGRIISKEMVMIKPKYILIDNVELFYGEIN